LVVSCPDVRPNAFVESHLVPVAGLIDALRRHKHDQGIVTQTLRLLQAKASRGTLTHENI
jgi:hypothetical protein